MSTLDTLVFTGPSLPINDARALLPNAAFHPPVACGDIIKAMRVKPKRIAIIDGYFEQQGAVWHKEILFAMHHGVKVYGASSMGALRAAELAPLGMVGVGEVFKAYQQNQLIDDDEVVLTHTLDFSSPITPMVNVRFTLKQALMESVIDQNTHDALISAIKAEPYYERRLHHNAKAYPKLKAWLNEHYIDQKRLDAIALLQGLATNSLPERNRPELSQSLFFHKIYREMIVEPFSEPFSWLPADELCWHALSQKPYFSLFKQCAKLLHILYDAYAIEHPNLKPTDVLSLAKQHQTQLVSQPQIIKFSLIHQNIYASYKSSLGFADLKHIRECDVQLASLLTTLSTLYMALIHFLDQRETYLNQSHAQHFSDEFRREHQLFDPNTITTWFKNNDLNNDEYQIFVSCMVIMYFLVDQHNFTACGVPTSIDMTCWGKLVMNYCS